MNPKSFLAGMFVTAAALVLTGQSWQTARISWTYSGLDEAGAPEAPTSAEYRIIPEAGTVDNAVATYQQDLALPGVPLEGNEYRADVVPVDTIPPGNYTAAVRIFDAENNGSAWSSSALEMLPPDAVPLPQVIAVTGSNGIVQITGTLTVSEAP